MNIIKSAGQQTSIRKFHKDVRGLSTVEYVILLVLIAVSAITIWNRFGGTIVGKVTTSNDRVLNMENAKGN